MKRLGSKNLKYLEEKAAGRRRPSGALNLSRLRGRHYNILNLHLAGFSNRDIATHLDISEVTVSNVINDPLSQKLLEERFVEVDRELRALLPSAVNVLRRQMDEKVDGALQLRAAENVFRIQGKFKDQGSGEKLTAEDIIAKLLEQHKESGGRPIEAKITVSQSRESGETPLLDLEGDEYE